MSKYKIFFSIFGLLFLALLTYFSLPGAFPGKSYKKMYRVRVGIAYSKLIEIEHRCGIKIMSLEKAIAFIKESDCIAADEKETTIGLINSVRKDSYGNPTKITFKSNSSIEFKSFGKDGKEGGVGEDADFIIKSSDL